MTARRPRLRYVCATPFERCGLVAQRLLPGRLFERLIRAVYDGPTSS